MFRSIKRYRFESTMACASGCHLTEDPEGDFMRVKDISRVINNLRTLLDGEWDDALAQATQEDKDEEKK
jgi:hypothetical protein